LPPTTRKPFLQLAIMHGELGALDAGFQYLNQAIENYGP
jgi:hypothetical protein